MYYRKSIDTEIIFQDENIYIRKGKFNYSNLEIRKNSYITDKIFQKISSFFKEINNKEKCEIQISEEDEVLGQVIKYLVQFHFLIEQINELNEFNNFLYVLDKQSLKKLNRNYLDKKNEIMDIEIFNSSINIDGIPIFILSEFSYKDWLDINKKLIKLKSKGIFLLVDGDFFHLFMVNNDYSWCLECFFLRMGSRIKNYSIFENIINNKKIMKNNLKNNILEFGISLSKMILEAQKINNSFFIESKILSVYIPTIEIHVDKLLKMASCSSCGYYSKLQSKEMNINTIAAVRSLIGDEK